MLPITNIALENDSKLIADKKNLIWILCRNVERVDQRVNSWTGFNIQANMEKVVLKDSIGYLPTIDSPATAMNTVYEILSKANDTKNALNLISILVVFNQAIYSKT